jgi:type II secretory pathway component GspD/PulD (secretin)
LVIKPLLGIPADLPQTTDGSIRLVPVDATNSLLVTAKPEVIKQVEAILKEIDKKTTGATGVESTAGPELKIYPVAGDSETIFKVLQTMVSGHASVRLQRDPSNGNIVALALPDQHETIRKTIETMEGKGLKKFRQWQLAPGADASVVLATINETLGAGGSAANAASTDPRAKVAPVASGAPKIVINTNNRSMLCFGTEAQLNQIDDLLRVLKWSDTAVKESGVGTLRSNVRVLPFHRDAVDLIKQHFPSMRRNPIEVVVPSQRGAGGGKLESIEPSVREKSFMHRTPIRTSPRASDEEEKADTKKPAKTRSSPERTTWRSSRVPPATYVGHRRGDTAVALTTPSRYTPSQYTSEQSEGAEGAPMKSKKSAAYPAPERAPEPNSSDGAKPQSGRPATNGEPRPKAGELPGSADKPVKITVTDKGIVISSEDPAALDAVEELLSLLPADPVASGAFKIYYLKHVSASVAKQELDQILTGDTGESGGTSTSGNLVGDVARGMLGSLGGSMVEGLLSSGSSGGVGSLVAGTPLIVPDDRLNALIVQAGPGEQNLIEQLLVYIDAEEGPDTKVARKPGLIPVFYHSADEIAAVVRELYQDRMITGARGGGGQQPSPREFIEALRGPSSGRGSARNQRRAEEADKMTVGVDPRSNSLIVVAPQTLFDEVDQLVAVLDQASEEPSNEVRRVITIGGGVSADALAKALKAIGGDKVTTTTTGTGIGPSTQTTRPGTTPGTTPTQPGIVPSPTGTEVSPEERIQRFMQLRELFPGGSSGRRGSDGGSDRGGSSRGFSRGPR